MELQRRIVLVVECRAMDKIILETLSSGVPTLIQYDHCLGGCDRRLTRRDEHTLRIFERRALSRIFGRKRDEIRTDQQGENIREGTNVLGEVPFGRKGEGDRL
jgi:hypothetical protein